MLISFLIFIFALALLVKGADFLVDGASSIAKRFKISDLVIGLTIVAFGTSMPELVVSLFASLQGNTEIAIGNIIGSNIANILLILGISAIIYPLSVTKGTVWKEIPFSLLAVVMVGIMANDALFDKTGFSALTRTDGLAMLGFFAIFMYYTFGIARQGQDETSDAENVKERSLGISILLTLAGLVLLVVGGKLGVDMAVKIALGFGLSQALVGLTIVAVGTSLPELATSAVAAYRKKSDIAVGNVVGSNIFNVFWILGLSSTISPLPFKPEANVDILVSIGAALLLFVAMFVGKRHHLERRDGVIYLLVYFAYIAYLVVRG